MPSNHLILCHPLPLLPSISPSIRIFSSESALHVRWPKYWGSFSFELKCCMLLNAQTLNGLWWLTSCVSSTGTQGVLVKHHFWVCLGGCFQMWEGSQGLRVRVCVCVSVGVHTCALGEHTSTCVSVWCVWMCVCVYTTENARWFQPNWPELGRPGIVSNASQERLERKWTKSSVSS